MEVTMRLRGIELANHLAKTLTDLEFEMLIRERVKNTFKALPKYNELNEAYCRAFISISPGARNASKWDISLGRNYTDTFNLTAEVLSSGVQLAYQTYMAKTELKLSNLLGFDNGQDTTINTDTIPF